MFLLNIWWENEFEVGSDSSLESFFKDLQLVGQRLWPFCEVSTAGKDRHPFGPGIFSFPLRNCADAGHPELGTTVFERYDFGY